MFKYDETYMARYLNRCKPEDKKVIRLFQARRIGRSLKYRAEITKYLTYMSEYFKRRPLLRLTQNDCIKYLNHLEKELADPRTQKSCIALFFEENSKTELGRLFRGKSRKSEKRKKWMEANALLSPVEIKKMISCCNSLRDKALLAILYDGGMRINELLTVKLKDIKREPKNRYSVYIGESKIAGQERRILLFESNKFLASWLACHPHRGNKEAYLFPSRNLTEHLSDYAVRKILKEVKESSGISKDVYPHLMRHSRTTHLLRMGMSEHAVKKRMGWSRASNTISRYTSLSDEDANDMFLKTFGEKPQEKEMLDTDLGQPLGEIEIEDSKDILLRKLLLDPTIQQILGARKTDDGRLIIELEE